MFPLLTKPTCLDGETFTVGFTVVLDCLLSKGEVGRGGDLIPDPEFEVCEWSLGWFHTGESLESHIQKDESQVLVHRFLFVYPD